MKKLVTLSILLLSAVTFSLSAQPAEGMQGRGKGMGMGPMGMQKMLKLTPEQEKQFKENRYKLQQKMIDFRSQIQKNRLELKNLISNNNIDEKKILDLTSADTKIQGEMKTARIQTWLANYKLLDKDQQEIWVKRMGMTGHRMRANFMRNRRAPMMNRRFQRFEGRRNMGMLDFENESPDNSALDQQDLLGIDIFDSPEFDNPELADMPAPEFEYPELGIPEIDSPDVVPPPSDIPQQIEK